MGYYISKIDSSFKILKENFDKTLKAIQQLHGQETAGNKSTPQNFSKAEQMMGMVNVPRSNRCFNWVNEDFWKRNNLKDILDDWRWEIICDDDGNIIDLEFAGEKYGDDKILFNQIAEFVENDSYITMRGEEGETWTWTFQNGCMIENLN